LHGYPFGIELSFTIKSMTMSKRQQDPNYVVLSLRQDTVDKFLGIITLKKEDADKMNSEVGSEIIVAIRSANYQATIDELEFEKKQLEQMPELASLHWAKVHAKVSVMVERYSAPDGSVGYEPYNYYATAFHLLDYEGIAILPIREDWASEGQISVGDIVVLGVTTPLDMSSRATH
jgi:hypothetical protein